jgi:hypothetical protein
LIGRVFKGRRSEDLAQIAEIMPQGAAAGMRYPEAMMKFVNI